MIVTNDLECSKPSRSTQASVGADLAAALNRLQRRLRSQRGEAALSDSQLAVLTALKRHGAMSPGSLADHENVRPPSMTRTVTSLSDLGLVTKVEHPTDRRQVLVELSAAGLEEVREVRRRRDQWLNKQLRTLTPEERATLAAATKLMTRIANA